MATTERSGRSAVPCRALDAAGAGGRTSRHVLALGLVLLGMWVFGPRGAGFTADDAALAAQVEALAGGSWTTPHPMPAVADDGQFHPDHLAARTVDGRFTAYAKHPLAPLLLLPGWQLAGRAGAELIVLGGLLAAAVAVSRVVRLVAPTAATGAMWVVAIGSAVAIHGFVLWMHGWALAAGALAVEAALRVAGSDRRGVLGRWVLLLGFAVAALVLLRSEGPLAAAAVAAGLAVAGIQQRRVDLVVLAGATAVGAVAVVGLEDRWVHHLVGATTTPMAGVGPEPFALSRVRAVHFTFLAAGSEPLAQAARWVPLIGLGLVCRRLRHRSPDRRLAVAAGVATAASVAAVVLVQPRPVVGLLAGLPLLVVPLLLPDADPMGATAGRIRVAPVLGSMAVTYLVLVGATAHAAGAGSDWGGRYALLVVPMLAPLVAARLVGLVRRGPAGPARAVVACLVVAGAVHGPLAYAEARRAERHTSAAVELVLAEAASLRPSPLTGRPVVVTTSPVLGRLLALEREAVTPLTAPQPTRLEDLLAALADEGVAELVLVGSAPRLEADEPPGSGHWQLGPTRPVAGDEVLRVAVRR